MTDGPVQLGLLPGFDEPLGGTVKGYAPVNWLDEETAFLPQPDDWICYLKDESPALSPADMLEALADKMRAEGDDRPMVTPLRDGEIVKFSRLTEFGSAFLEISEDGRWSVTRDPPAQAMVCLDDDRDMDGSRSVSAIARDLLSRGEVRGTIEYRLSSYDWSDGIPYRFDAAGRRFVLVEAP